MGHSHYYVKKKLKNSTKELFFACFYFTGQSVILETDANLLYRGIIADLTTIRGEEFVLFRDYNVTRPLETHSVRYIRPDCIADPPEWNPTGKPIALHEYRIDDADDPDYYNVYKCQICGLYSTFLERHKATEHGYRGHMRGNIRPRNLLREFENSEED